MVGLPPEHLFDISVRHLRSHGGGSGQDVAIIEHLRVRVDEDAHQAWISAEQQCWEPWLEQQEGFVGRDLLWDPRRQEGILLIHWASRESWLAIPPEEVAAVQARFEACARDALRHRDDQPNPFPLVLATDHPPASPLPAFAAAA